MSNKSIQVGLYLSYHPYAHLQQRGETLPRTTEAKGRREGFRKVQKNKTVKGIGTFYTE